MSLLTSRNKMGEKRVWWSESENSSLLQLIGKLQVVRALVRKRQKNADIFKVIEKKMRIKGSTKCWQQIRSRWKRMKSEYIREKRIRGRRQSRRPNSSANDTFFHKMTEVLGKYAECIECTSAYLGEEEAPLLPLIDDDENNFIYEGGSKIDSASPDENNPDLEVEDNPAAVLEQSMSFEEDENNNINEVELIIQPQPEILEIKSEPTLADCSVEDDDQELAKDNGAAKLEFSINDSPLLTNEETAASTSGSDPPSKQNITDMVKIFAETYAVRHSSQLREWQEQYQVWFQRQLESQQQWQEMFMREQIEQTRSMVQNVTTTFLQEMQQLLQNVITNVSHRPMVPFIPSISRNSECVFSVVPNTAGTM